MYPEVGLVQLPTVKQPGFEAYAVASSSRPVSYSVPYHLPYQRQAHGKTRHALLLLLILNMTTNANHHLHLQQEQDETTINK